MTIERVINCEWWILRAAFIQTYKNAPPYPERSTDQWIQHGWQTTMYETSGEQKEVGSIKMTGEDIETTIVVEDLWGEFEVYWQHTLLSLERFNLNVNQARLNIFQKTPEKAIEYYYRVRARGRKITIGEVARLADFSESYLRKIKVDYDRAGKWGSKSRKR